MLTAALVLTTAPAAAQNLAPAFEGACPADEEREVIARVNAERASRGLAALALDVRLGASAVRHSEDMAGGCFLSHTGSDGSTAARRVADAGYPAYAGEVAGAGQRTPAEIVSGWMASPGHHAILMQAAATHIGVGHVGRPPCVLEGFGFPVSDFWTADLGHAPGAAFGEQEHCAGGAPPGPDPPVCSDGFDNDGDGRADYGEDEGCHSPSDESEDYTCRDGLDNDEDGLVDFPADDGCAHPNQVSESDPSCGIGFEVALILPPLMRLRRRRSRPHPEGEGPRPGSAAGSARTRR